MKKGRPYYYVREMARVEGKPKVINQVYLGSPERILEMATTSSVPKRLQAQEFGALWLADLVQQDVGVAELIDRIVPKEKDEEGPSVGEYFLYAIYNRMIDACSKRAMPDWYKGTAIQHIRPVDVDALNSQLFWKKWDRVEAPGLEQIAQDLFGAIQKIEPTNGDCFLFDTTNYFTFMASDTPSELAQRGKNKEGRNWLRQIGLALLVSRDNRLPLLYREYEGNRHDSKVFGNIIEEVFHAMTATGERRMTVVFDKGMNSEDNVAAIDAKGEINFITTYSTHYAEDLVHGDRAKFTPVDSAHNRRLVELNKHEDCLLAWRTERELWGQMRTVIVTYNPRTATKQRYGFEKRLLSLQETLFEFKSKVNKQAPHWRNKASVLERYQEVCAQLHLPADLYTVEISEDNGLRFNFHKNHYRIGRHIDHFGKNLIVTDCHDWTTDEIVQASLDRWMVEDGFRQSKDDDLVAMMPVRHFTDSKIRCHIFTCVAALALLRLVEIKLVRAGLKMTAKTAMRSMHRLHSCLVWLPGKRKPERIVEEPDEVQAQILDAFGYEVLGGVLQKSKK